MTIEPAPRQKCAHLWERQAEDWYAESPACSAALFRQEPFVGPILDPACGRGHILRSARAAGFEATGRDIVQRGAAAELGDFLDTGFAWNAGSIVTNPPFALLPQFVEKIATVTPHRSAVLVPATWLHSLARMAWSTKIPIRKVLAIVPRPSMPPGEVWERGEKPGGGTKDFSWLIIQPGYDGLIGFGWCCTKAAA